MQLIIFLPCLHLRMFASIGWEFLVLCSFSLHCPYLVCFLSVTDFHVLLGIQLGLHAGQRGLSRLSRGPVVSGWCHRVVISQVLLRPRCALGGSSPGRTRVVARPRQRTRCMQRQVAAVFSILLNVGRVRLQARQYPRHCAAETP